MAFDCYQMVTDRIIEELEKGNIPWQKGWSGTAEGAYNYVSRKPYSLLNQLMLKHDDAYLSFKQVTEKGGKVKKGAKAEAVVFWKMHTVEEDVDGEKKRKQIPILRHFNVFWIGDTTLERDDREVKPTEHEPIKEAETVIQEYLLRETELKFQNTEPSNEAYYRPSTDTVVVPMLSQFECAEEYYSTAFHEFIHSTGNAKRLNRLTKCAAFGNEDYSKEELVAELGAAMLVNQCGIETEKSFRNSAGYLQGWLKALKNDKRMIVSAAGRAEKAVKFIRNGREAVAE